MPASAKVDLPPRTRWHGLRRKFATELKHLPLKDRCRLGGWKDPKTLLMCCQQPDEDMMRQVLAAAGSSGFQWCRLGARGIDTMAECTG